MAGAGLQWAGVKASAKPFLCGQAVPWLSLMPFFSLFPRLPYNQYFGGVSALSKEQFTKINGFPNNYWGWGGEDDDIYNR